MTIPRKAVAISASEHDGLNYLYAPGESGIVYDFDYSAQKWDPLPPLPPVEASDDCQAPKLHTWIVAFDSGRESVVRNCSSSDEAMSIARSAYPNEQISFVRIAQPEIAPPSTSTHEVPEFIDMCHPPPCATVQPIATIAVRAKCFDVADKAFRKEFPHAKILRVTKMPSQVESSNQGPVRWDHLITVFDIDKQLPRPALWLFVIAAHEEDLELNDRLKTLFGDSPSQCTVAPSATAEEEEMTEEMTVAVKASCLDSAKKALGEDFPNAKILSFFEWGYPPKPPSQGLPHCDHYIAMTCGINLWGRLSVWFFKIAIDKYKEDSELEDILF